MVKNKIAPPFTQAEFDIMYDSGISYEGDLVDLGAALGVVQKSGAWFSCGDVRLGQGRENTKTFLKENPDIFTEISHETKQRLGMIPSEPTETAGKNSLPQM